MCDVARLIGVRLGHACWIIVNLEQGELICPFVVIEWSDGSRSMQEFEADSQAEAVARGKAFLVEPVDGLVRMVFIRDGLLRNADGTATDVLSVTGWDRGQSELTVCQTYHHDDVNGLTLLGDPFVALGDVEDEAMMLAHIFAGIDSHVKAGLLWNSWGGRKINA